MSFPHRLSGEHRMGMHKHIIADHEQLHTDSKHRGAQQPSLVMAKPPAPLVQIYRIRRIVKRQT